VGGALLEKFAGLSDLWLSVSVGVLVGEHLFGLGVCGGDAASLPSAPL
tara:strand:+ start:9429 stop:9572 length:144 start_codon:yes stop_codon:yes gene_type:complete